MKTNIGVGPMQAQPGGKFISLSSNEYDIGEQVNTWAGHMVRVTGKQPTGIFGSWKYRYEFEVVAARSPRHAR